MRQVFGDLLGTCILASEAATVFPVCSDKARTTLFSTCVRCVCVCVGARVYARQGASDVVIHLDMMCVCVYTNTHAYTHIYLHVHIYIRVGSGHTHTHTHTHTCTYIYT